MTLKEALERQLERLDRIAEQNAGDLRVIGESIGYMKTIGDILAEIGGVPESRLKVYGIRACRRAAGMTQEELAKKMGIARSALAMWETGKASPRTETLRRLADTLGCTVDDLLGNTAAG